MARPPHEILLHKRLKEIFPEDAKRKDFESSLGFWIAMGCAEEGRAFCIADEGRTITQDEGKTS